MLYRTWKYRFILQFESFMIHSIFLGPREVLHAESIQSREETIQGQKLFAEIRQAKNPIEQKVNFFKGFIELDAGSKPYRNQVWSTKLYNNNIEIQRVESAVAEELRRKQPPKCRREQISSWPFLRAKATTYTTCRAARQ